MIKRICALFVFSLFCITTLAYAADKPPSSTMSWRSFLQEIRQEAIAQGVRPSVVAKALNNLPAPDRKVMHYARTQPEKRLTFLKYRNTRASTYRIKLGRQELRKHSELIQRIAGEYGVNACFIASLWGLETSYGRFMGSFPVIKSLATLAYTSPHRHAFFRKQLLAALHILNGDHVKLSEFKGEWAGASGQSQFLPTSWMNYAVDHNGDGKKDIWKNHGDIFASIANYLVQHGWKRNQPWAIEVTTPRGFDEALMTRKVTKTVKEWQALGVHASTRPLPEGNLEASIVRPYGGPTYMIFNNFKVIMRWNRSIYYAGTVGYMAEQICQHPL